MTLNHTAAAEPIPDKSDRLDQPFRSLHGGWECVAIVSVLFALVWSVQRVMSCYSTRFDKVIISTRCCNVVIPGVCDMFEKGVNLTLARAALRNQRHREKHDEE